jgi:putative DNA primase/helicase
MSNLPDFSRFCEATCIAVWGQPNTRTKKELRWTNGDAYGARTYTINKHAWYDHGAERGGSTLELLAYSKGLPNEKLRGRAFFDMWQALYELGVGIDPPPSPKLKWPILATYPYPDENNVLLFEVVRFDTTDPAERFRQRQPDGKGDWIWNLKGVRRVLYRLPELIAAVKAGQRVLLTEGEKDANTAVKLGYAATTMPGGVGKWRPEYDEFFRGADVVVVSDNDEQLKDPKTGKLQHHADGEPKFPGQDHANKVAKRLAKVAVRVRKIMFEVKDLTQWAEAGGTREQMDALIEQAPEYQVRREPQPEPRPELKPDGDGGLEDNVALEFSAKYAETVRYVAAWNRWYIWDGACWRHEKTRFAYDLARPLCRKEGDARAKTVNAVVTLVNADRRQAATVEQWDANPWLLGTPQGAVDLRTGKLLPPKTTDYITKTTSVAPSEKADCPLWLGHLEKVTRGDKELQAYLKRCAGYCLTGVTTEHSLFFLFGTGRNGKGVFMNALTAIWQDYAKVASMDMFIVTRGERHPTDLAHLHGARLVTAVETEAGRRWDEAKLKQMTGGDPISARFMRQDFFDYIPQFKLVIAGNHKPSIRSVDEAIKARMGLTPFTVFIPKKERDKDFGEKLKPEHPAILRWAIEGCLEWQKVGLQPPKAVVDATAGYMVAQDVLQAFLDECCVVDKSEHDTITHIYDGYVDWAEACHEFIWTKRDLVERLENLENVERVELGKECAKGFRGLRCIRENAEKLMAEAKRKREEMEAAMRRAPWGRSAGEEGPD